jgi:hypothetical protein
MPSVLMVVEVAAALADTVMCPPLSVSLVTVPSTIAVPPTDTVKWDADPPADTFNVPPPDTAK